MKKAAFLFIICTLSIALALPACTGQREENTIVVAVLGPMQFMQGQHHWYGATKAAKEINESGGITIGDQQYMLKAIKVETNEILDVPGAANATERAITVDKANFLVGGFRTESVFAMMDVAMDSQTIFLDCGAATMDLCKRVAEDYERYKYFFRVGPVNTTFLGKLTFLQLGMVGKMMKQELGLEEPLKVALIAEKLMWADPIIAAAERGLPMLAPGSPRMQLVGVFRPSDTRY